MAEKKFSYNKSIEEIETILEEIENKEIDIDQLTAKVKKALDLLSQCKNKLEKTENEVSELLKGLGGE